METTTTTRASIGRKGVVTAILVAVVIIALVIEAFYTANIVISSNVIRQDARETAAISAINGMDFLKRVMQEAVTYATERATHDVLSAGGYDSIPSSVDSYDGMPYWREYTQTYAPDFKSSLEAAMAKDFENYGTTYGSAYKKLEAEVTLYVPSYSECGAATVMDNGETVGVTITNNCDDGLEASNDLITVKEANANFTDDVDANVFDLVANAKSTFLDSDPVAAAIKNGADASECKVVSISEDSCSYGGYSDSDIGSTVLEAGCAGWKDKLVDAIKSKLSTISVSGADVSFDAQTDDVSADYTVESCDACSQMVSTTYACVTGNTVSSCDECTSGTCSQSTKYSERTFYRCDGSIVDSCSRCDSGDCQEGTETVEETVYRCGTSRSVSDCGQCDDESSCESSTVVSGYKTACTYSYKADADIGVTVTPSDEKYYPIYDSSSESVVWSRMSLEFRILDGMIGSLKADDTA